MRTSMSKLGISVTAGSLLAGAPLLAACDTGSSGPTYNQWAATDGAAGRINLDDVQVAFKKSESATEFEKRVNEIYEGDGIILVRAKQEESGLTLEGWEDLDSDDSITDGADDLLFTIVQKDDRHVMQGHHANAHYHNSFGGGEFLFGYMLGSMMGGPRTTYVYQTPPAQGTNIRNERAQYRNSDSYRNQVSRNTQYAGRQQQFSGSKYSDASRNVSPARQTYQQSARSTGAFRSSNSLTGTSYRAGTSGSSSISRGSVGSRGASGSVGGRGGGSGFSGSGGGVATGRTVALDRPAWLA